MSVKRMTVASVLMVVTMSSAFAVDLARVNGKVISEKEVNASLSSVNQGQRRKILGDADARGEVVTNLIQQELLTQEAEKQKLDQDALYKEALAQFRRQFLSQRLLDQYVAPRMTPEAVKGYYTTGRRKYSTDQVEVLHILVNDEKTAQEVSRLAKAPNADFQVLAEKYSKDPSAKNNRGYVGAIGWDAPFAEEFKETAFATPRGQIGGPVKTAFGYHILKVQNKKTGYTKSFDEVELLVRDELRRNLVQGYVNQLRRSAQVVTFPKAIEKLQ